MTNLKSLSNLLSKRDSRKNEQKGAETPEKIQCLARQDETEQPPSVDETHHVHRFSPARRQAETGTAACRPAMYPTQTVPPGAGDKLVRTHLVRHRPATSQLTQVQE
eukprot:CAMPEP_0204429586 /NCGR_PEP_ID=MMETSP0470-20130426/60633_1 /ASSEMBLY_ACC=CAM_ASM_000385 /TAXON_ID=2969 /ORGANISM="Oxyrrhis marina" /LENGTH=106 /DNA_ID=CAMNT_0051427631 /DNA_START=232 /DNA_END=552 /DNA_ORIENTATION=+